MKLPLTLSFTLMTALSSSAHKLTVKKMKHPHPHRRSLFNSPSDLQVNVGSQNSSFDINTVHDLIYLANITVGGVDYPVQLDTGSSDLFIKGATSPLPNANETSLSTNLTYAIGWAAGNIAYSSVEFLGINISSQALLDAQQVNNPALGYGAQGIAGLGFTRLSTIDAKLNSTGSSTGRSLMFNLFASNPSEPNFIAFALQRSSEPGDDVEGSFSIGEYDPAYEAVSGNEKISTWPLQNPYRWNVLVDAVIVNQSTITSPSTNVVGAPSNKAVALMDSGSSYTYAPKYVTDAIYSNLPGATFDSAAGYWTVPCTLEIDMALQIGGQVFPIHPLDVTPTTPLNPTVCIGSFIPATFASGNDFDWLVGDNFLRSVYSVYDFGDFDSTGQMGNPYMKFLSIVEPDQGSIDFCKERGCTPKSNITYTGLNGVSVAPSFSISNDISQSLELIGKWVPAILGIVALNALVLIVCCIVWLVSLIRRRRNRVPARTPRSRMSPMPMNLRNSYAPGNAPANGYDTYEPVSMALTEDTFVPPSPAFHRFGDKLGQGDRPKSVA